LETLIALAQRLDILESQASKNASLLLDEIMRILNVMLKKLNPPNAANEATSQ
jgi:hypothetical protein